MRHHQLWKQANHGHPEPRSLYCQLQTLSLGAIHEVFEGKTWKGD